MRRWFAFLMVIVLALPAYARDVFTLVENDAYEAAAREAQGQPLLEAYVHWSYVRDPKTPTPIDFSDGYGFLAKHLNWPDEKIIRLRTEEAALNSSPSSTIKSFCTRFPPISGRGMFACAGITGTDAQRREWISEGWKHGDFSENEEARILDTYGKYLTESDHRARMERLLFEEKTAQARRLIPFLPRDRQQLYLAAIALINNDRDAELRLNNVPVNQRKSPALILARIEWRHGRGDEAGVRELFLNHPIDPPYADQWWKYRAHAIREAMEDGRYQEALKIVSNHGDLKPEFLAEALFLKGWINLSYLRNTRAAYKDFYKLYTASKTPVSKARAAYWAAQSAKKNGNPEIKNQWLEKAASRSFSFFGQLAYEERYPNKPLPIPAAPTPSASEDARFNSEELVKLVRTLTAARQPAIAERFIKHLAETTDEPTRFVLIANLARAQVGTHAAVKVAKQALRDGVVLVGAGWPLKDIPNNNTIEPALALAIIRQESEFDASAVSPANARGLMQLLPATARETARNNNVPVDARDLFNPTVNIMLGMHYLDDMIAFMDGSYVLGIASYNAGPGNVRDWRKSLGHPGESPQGAIHWIENIPFAETRNYVMRVLENLQIYRRLLDENATPQVSKDLVR